MAAVRPAEAQWASDQWLENPVSDETFENYLGFFSYDAARPFQIEVLETTQVEGIHVERIRFESTQGIQVFAEYFRAAGPIRGGRPHVIMVHGGGKVGKTMMRPFAESVVRRGMNVLTIDLLYFGERDTGLLTTFSAQDKADNLYNRPSAYLDWVVQTTKDVGRSFDLLVERYGANPDRIAYHGFSRGAEVGFIVAGVERRFRAVSLAYGGHFDRLETGHLAAACPANYIGRISPRPLWLLNGTFDSDYDRELSVEPLHRHLGDPHEIHWTETGHQIPSPEDHRTLSDWLSRQLMGG
jgi:dienelactone hydrolase